MKRQQFSVLLTRQMTCKVPAEVDLWYRTRASKAGTARSVVVREVLIDYYELHSGKTVNRREYQP